jgi:hypothetical protein
VTPVVIVEAAVAMIVHDNGMEEYGLHGPALAPTPKAAAARKTTIP